MSAPISLRVRASRVKIRNAFTRLPFRFGVVTMTASPVGILEVEAEDETGAVTKGYAADFLAYKWFDKRPDKTPADNVADLLAALRHARAIYEDADADTPFALWRDTRQEIEERVLADDFNRLGASFAASMLERAVIDAAGRLTGQPFDAMVRTGLLGIDCASVFSELAADAHLAALPHAPLKQVALRHTVGLVDPIVPEDVGPDAPDDGLPVSLHSYLVDDRLRYLKVKVSGNLAEDLDRLERIAGVMASVGRPIGVTLDGNEQYKSLDDFVTLMVQIQAREALADFYDAILFIEQPLDRQVAMSAPLDEGALATIGRPLLIDEADGWTEAYAQAIELGYQGVSHKNCKGVYRSLMNAALAAHHNARTESDRYFLSAEDLTNLPVVPLQADLAVVATLGIGHVERNGHHYFHGLDHLPKAEQEAALARHPDLYARLGEGVGLNIDDGMLSIGSLQVPGLGVVDPPDMDAAIDETAWTFDMLERRT
ncbi:MAG: mandelate racemase [Rhodospirillaceae bacterium]|nr:mandelate racemase [Rhodospirillaceae bacterium]